jgi:hypothetical protein
LQSIWYSISHGVINPVRSTIQAAISKCGDGRLRTLLYEAANAMLPRYCGSLALKNWALEIAQRSTLRKARGRVRKAPNGICRWLKFQAKTRTFNRAFFRRQQFIS